MTSPSERILDELRARILTGELRAGDRVPSVRQLAQNEGVAIATATKVLAGLRDDGLVETKVGSGTVVSKQVRQPARGPRQGLTRRRVLRAAIAIADREGLEAVSMRRLAVELGVGPMSLYRHIDGKDELLAQLADEVFGDIELPDPGPEGWRAKLELISRLQWELCRRHNWLPRAISFTRPVLLPNLMAQTEWTLRALDGLGLSITTMTREALTLHTLVVTAALSRANEIEAEQETGVTLDLWWLNQRERADELLGRFPLLATTPAGIAADLDRMFEYSLARHLDGFAVLLGSPTRGAD